MVTLEGEYLSPGGSMSGGAFKNSSNLLGRKKRNRRTRKKYCAEKEIEELKQRNLDIRTAKDLLTEDLEQLRGDLQKALILKNTAQMNVSRAKEQKEESESVFSGLQEESVQIEQRIAEIHEKKEQIAQQIEQAATREKRDRAGKCSLPGNLR